MYWFRVRVKALRSPAKWVPPSRCGILLVKAEDAFLVGIIPLQSHLYADTVTHGIEIDNIRMQGRFVAVEVFDKRADTALIFKNILLFAAFIR